MIIKAEDHLGLLNTVVKKFTKLNEKVEDTEEFFYGYLGLDRGIKTYESNKGAISTWLYKNIVYRIQSYHYLSKKRKVFISNTIINEIPDHTKITVLLPSIENMTQCLPDMEKKFILNKYQYNISCAETGRKYNLGKELSRRFKNRGLDRLRKNARLKLIFEEVCGD